MFATRASWIYRRRYRGEKKCVVDCGPEASQSMPYTSPRPCRLGGGSSRQRGFGNRKAQPPVTRQSAAFGCSKYFTHRNLLSGELISPKILLFNVEDRLIAGGFHEPGDTGETRSDEIVDSKRGQPREHGR